MTNLIPMTSPDTLYTAAATACESDFCLRRRCLGLIVVIEVKRRSTNEDCRPRDIKYSWHKQIRTSRNLIKILPFDKVCNITPVPLLPFPPVSRFDSSSWTDRYPKLFVFRRVKKVNDYFFVGVLISYSVFVYDNTVPMSISIQHPTLYLNGTNQCRYAISVYDSSYSVFLHKYVQSCCPLRSNQSRWYATNVRISTSTVF